MPKPPKMSETKIKKWEKEYYQILRQEYDNAKVSNIIVKKIYNHFMSELDKDNYYRVAKDIERFINFAILTKNQNGKIKCDFTLDSNMLRIPDYEYYFGNTNDVGPRFHMDEIILHNDTPKDILNKVMMTKRETDVRKDLLQCTLVGEYENLDKLFKVNNSKKLYTTYEIMIEVKSILTAISKLLSEILDTKNGEILMDFMDAKKNYWKNISPLCDYFITLYRGRKEQYIENTIHKMIIERALQDYCDDDNYVPISRIAIREVLSDKDKEYLVYKMPRSKKK